MRFAVFTTSALIGTVLVSSAAPALKGWRRLLPTVSGDVAITKERAERGDAKSQVELADNLMATKQVALAVGWFRKAAEQGNVEAKFRLGDILLNGASSGPDPDQRVEPNATEGVRWTYEAATNFHSGACRNMAFVLENGVGLSQNLVEAYAWLEVYARSNSAAARPDMNRLALQMDLPQIRESHALAGQFFSREWSHHGIRQFSEGDLPLKLNGITIGPVPLATINGQAIEQGGSALLPAKNGTACIKCIKITQDAVVVVVEGDSEPRVLRLK